MADPAERIRALVLPPSPPWGERLPKTKTLRQDIERWYANAGGLNRAVELARQAQAERAKDDTMPEFPFWEPEMLDKEFTVTAVGGFDDAAVPGSTRAVFYPRRQTIAIGPEVAGGTAPGSQASLEHERGHGVFGGDYKNAAYLDALIAARDDAGVMPRWRSYVTKPAEMDVRLAQVKRLYAHATGRIVDTPEEAQRALDWYIRNYETIPQDTPSSPALTRPEDAIFYNSLPAQKKQKALRRMTEVVSSGTTPNTSG
jgi:hypothetical protein